MEFRSVRRSPSRKRNLLLSLNVEDIERIEALKPIEITTQEAIRQIVKDFLDENEALGGL